MQPNSGSSLSFLDLLTCALGGILLLFFVVVCIRDQSDSVGSSRGHSSSGETEQVVFVHVFSLDRTSIFTADGANLRLERNGKPVPDLTEGSSSGDSFASFFCDVSVPANSQLVLRNLADSVDRSKIQVFVADRFGAREMKLPPGSPAVLYSFGVPR